MDIAISTSSIFDFGTFKIADRKSEHTKLTEIEWMEWTAKESKTKHATYYFNRQMRQVDEFYAHIK